VTISELDAGGKNSGFSFSFFFKLSPIETLQIQDNRGLHFPLKKSHTKKKISTKALRGRERRGGKRFIKLKKIKKISSS
jgi:hypothetical protein